MRIYSLLCDGLSWGSLVKAAARVRFWTEGWGPGADFQVPFAVDCWIWEALQGQQPNALLKPPFEHFNLCLKLCSCVW